MSIGLSKPISLFISFCLILEQAAFAQVAQNIDLSAHFAHFGRSIAQTDKFRPLHLRSISYDSQSQGFKLLLDKGDFIKGLSPQGTVPDEKLQEETQTLFNYFRIGLTLPNDKFWVNLRPDSPENILDPDLERTDIGRIFLEADLQLKKDTAQWTSPRTPEGKVYWDKLYKKAGELFGSENISIPALTRPWIVPNEIIIRESPDDAYIYKATLKVMLEEDYLKSSQLSAVGYQQYTYKDPRLKELNEYSTQLIRENILPKLTYEVNTSKRYAQLRQVYYSLILAQWFKQRYKGLSPKGTVPFLKLIDSGDLTNLICKKPFDKQTYFRQYQKSFKDGEYNLSEPVYTPSGQGIRRYMSGGGRFGLKIPSAGSSSITDRETDTRITLVPAPKKKIIIGLLTFLITIGSLFDLTLEDRPKAQAKDMIAVSSTKEIPDIGLITRVDESSGERVFFISKESIEKNPGGIVTLFLNIINGTYDLGKLNSRRLSLVEAIAQFNNLISNYPSIIREIITQQGVPILLETTKKVRTYSRLVYHVIATILGYPELQRSERQLIVETLLRDEYLKSDMAGAVFSILSMAMENDIAQLIIAKGVIPKLIELAQDKDYEYFFMALNLLSQLVKLSPEGLREQDSESIVLLLQDALYGDNFLEAVINLKEIIGARPRRYGKILKQISDKRKRVVVLPSDRASEEVVLLVFDKYKKNQLHAFDVISQMLSELESTAVDLNNEQFLDKAGKELGVGQPRENIDKITKALFHKHGILLRMIEPAEDQSDGEGEKELMGIVKENQDKTIIVLVPLKDYIFASFLRIANPTLINGIIDPSINQLGAKELLLIVGAGNEGLPRIYTHTIFDNIIVVGAAYQDNGNYKRAPYSNYGPDISLSTVPNKEGTSFSVPKFGGIIANLLTNNPKMSVREAVEFLKNQAVPMDDDPLFRDGFLGQHGVVMGRGDYKGQKEKVGGSVEPDNNSSLKEPESSANSPLNFGGIDFTHLPLVTQAITNLGSSPLKPSSYLSLRQLNLSEEYQAIERVASSGISPHPERLMSFLQASCLQDRIEEDKDKALGLLSDVLRDEEFSLRLTEPGLRDILIVLESATSSQQLKEIFLGKGI